MNTEQIMALVDAYADRAAENARAQVTMKVEHRASYLPKFAEAIDDAREKVFEAIESLQNRDDWK